MSSSSSLLDQKSTIDSSIQHLTHIGNRLLDQCWEVKVDVCHYLLTEQNKKLEDLNDTLKAYHHGLFLQQQKEQEKD